MKTSLIYVNAYLVQRCYGGPEEGGWWFDSGTPLAAVPLLLADRYESEDDDEYQHGQGCPDFALLSLADQGERQRIENDLLKALADHNERCEYDGKVVVYTQFGFPVPFPAEAPHYE